MLIPTFRRSLPLLAAAMLTVTAAEAAEVTGNRDAFVPYNQYQSLPGKAIGVLVSDVQTVLAREHRSSHPDEMDFSTGGNSYRWVYVPDDARPTITDLQVPVGEKGTEKKVYPRLRGANAEGVKQWGLTVPYALVEVEVNSGLGSPANASFVATNMKRLDGTRDYPLDVPEVINRLRRDYQAHKQDEQKAIEGAMEKAQKEAMDGRRPTEPRETEEEMYVTWLPEAQRLQVRFRTMVTDGEFHPCRPGSNPLRRPGVVEPNSGLYGTLFGVEYGMSYEVTKTGKLEQTLALPIKDFHRDWEFFHCPREPRIYPLPPD